MKIKKLFIYIICIFSLAVITGCQNTDELYHITYDTDGGILVGNYVTEFENYTDVQLSLVTKDGFIFQGWYEGETKVTLIDENRNYSLKAKWLSELDNPNTQYGLTDKVNINNVKIVDDKLLIDVNNLSSDSNRLGLLVCYGDELDIRLDSANTYNFYLEEAIAYFNENISNHLRSNITLRPYYIETVLDITTVYYGEPTNIKLIDIVEDADSSLSKEILDAHNIIYEVSISLDTANYKASSNNQSLYSAAVKKPIDYIYIVTKIEIASDYTFFDTVTLIVNDKVVNKGINLSSDKKLITYTIEDPNWTQIW